jgi:hypothetical protein
MPAGYSSRCKACNSPIRLQIEAWHDEGLGSRTISARLRESGERISDRALDNHFAEHYDVQAEVQEQYQQSQANLQQAAGERVSEIKMLDEVAQDKYDLHQKLGKILTNMISGLEGSEGLKELPKLAMAYVALYNGCAAEIRQALKTKQELLGEDGEAKKAKALESWVDLMLED